ncbi:uncharacterized protein LOC111632075 [Centruroides sculpturatus]|uniref:uncharacterized protein LOC111632075 n=1 Tax=Centruroides sculpturatus TaxID=218467 RepID=UPI000C6E1974|nr:uncharacterized protein LOC111632075 [Centruroides sculpturatus]
MARNEEKQYSRLNRLLLQQEREEYRKRNPKRPRLDNLNSVEEIKEWLPSIKRDLDFSLKQSEVTCYSEQKISEIQSNILQLEREFKSFVRKSKRLNPEMNCIPWTNRPYKSNKMDTKEDEYQDLNQETSKGNVHDKSTFIQIKTPILKESSAEVKDSNVCFTNVNMDRLDRPLEFKTTESNVTNKVIPSNEDTNLQSTDRTESLPHSEDGARPSRSKRNLLGLDYSSSDSET